MEGSCRRVEHVRFTGSEYRWSFAEGLPMPRLLFYEAGRAPSTRSVRELRTLINAGWDVAVAVLPEHAARVNGLRFRPCLLPASTSNPLYERLGVQAEALTEQLRGVRRELDEAIAADDTSSLRAELAQAKDRIDELAARVRQHRAGGDSAAEANARADLAAAKDQGATIAERIRALGAHGQVAELRQRRDALAAKIRAVGNARTMRTPLTNGSTFGDLARLEPQWHDAAQVLASEGADLFWAADLNALPPVIWASEAAAPGPTPVVFDSHESFCDLTYLPDLYKEGWRTIADTFIPLATAVLAVSERIAQVLRDEHGAQRMIVVPNYALPGAAPDRTVRAVLGLPAHVPLAVHIGNVFRTRSPHTAVDLAAEVPDIHVAFVGEADEGVVEQLKETARARGVDERLHFVPAVPATELTGFLADADLSVILYTAEGARNLELTMPNKLYDSLAAGLPIVAASGSAAADFIVAEGLGHVYDASHPAQIGAAVRQLLADGNARERARQRSAEFIWPNAEPIILSLVDELVAAARASA
jgi:glycosyltransferase involved in cell wall biosynthesis